MAPTSSYFFLPSSERSGLRMRILRINRRAMILALPIPARSSALALAAIIIRHRHYVDFFSRSASLPGSIFWFGLHVGRARNNGERVGGGGGGGGGGKGRAEGRKIGNQMMRVCCSCCRRRRRLLLLPFILSPSFCEPCHTLACL